MIVTFRFCHRSQSKSLKLPVFKGISADLSHHRFYHISFYPLYSYVRDDYGDFFEQEHIKSVREQWLECAFVRNFPKMVEEVGDVKFYTDLQPNAQLPDLIPEKIFEEQIKGLSYEEIEQLLTHYRSKKYQLVLLEFAKQYEYWRDNVESAIFW